MERTVYMVQFEDGSFLQSGRNYTPATFYNVGAARGQVTLLGYGKVVKIVFVEEVK